MGGKDCLHGIKFRLGMKRESNEKMDAFWRIHLFGGDCFGPCLAMTGITVDMSR